MIRGISRSSILKAGSNLSPMLIRSLVPAINQSISIPQLQVNSVQFHTSSIPLNSPIFSNHDYNKEKFSPDIPVVKLAFEKHKPDCGFINHDDMLFLSNSEKPIKTPIIFLHGLFGSKSNNRTVSKELSTLLNCDIYCLDLRNHGDSPHSERMDYGAMAADVEQFIKDEGLKEVIVIGHSMGGKVAMSMSLRPSKKLIKYLIVVENAPIDAQASMKFGQYISQMKKINHGNISSKKEATNILKEVEENVSIQQFLMMNCTQTRDNEGKRADYQFKIPVDVIGKWLDHIAGWPFLPNEAIFSRPSLFIRGTKSK